MQKSILTGRLGIPTSGGLFSLDDDANGPTSTSSTTEITNITSNMIKGSSSSSSSSVDEPISTFAVEAPSSSSTTNGGAHFVRTGTAAYTERARTADLVFLCCSQNKDNFGMVDQAFISGLKPGVLVVNVARVRGFLLIRTLALDSKQNLFACAIGVVLIII